MRQKFGYCQVLYPQDLGYVADVISTMVEKTQKSISDVDLNVDWSTFELKGGKGPLDLGVSFRLTVEAE